MTIPVGIATFFFYPDVPHNTRVRYLTDEEIRLSLDRVHKAGKAAPAKITLSTFLRVAKRWRMRSFPPECHEEFQLIMIAGWYAFTLGYVVSFTPMICYSIQLTSVYSSTDPAAVQAATSPSGSRQKTSPSRTGISSRRGRI